MYKVLNEISEEVIHGQRADTSLSVGGRVRNPEMKSMLAKQLGQGLQSLEGATLVDTKTGRIASKKGKKEKTKEQLAVDELKKMKTKFLGSICSYGTNVCCQIRCCNGHGYPGYITTTKVEEGNQGSSGSLGRTGQVWHQKLQ